MTRARNIANRALSDITSPNTNQDITITPNGAGDVIAETDTFTIKNTSDLNIGPILVLDHTTSSPAVNDVSIIKAITTDAGGTSITPFQLQVLAPDKTSGAATGQAKFFVKEDIGSVPQTYITLDGDAEQVTFAKPIVNSSLITASGGLRVDSKLDINDVVEKVFVYGQGAGTFNYNTFTHAVAYDTTTTTANRGLNFQYINSQMTNGQSRTVTWILTMGTTAYYPTTISIDGTDVTSSVKWQGGSAPTSGNPNGLDIYTFTIIKTADATFTVLASQTQFA